MDNFTHTKTEVREWLAVNPRIHVHFTLTSASGIIERQAIHRGTFHNVRELTRIRRRWIFQARRYTQRSCINFVHEPSL